jgi:hypothetical protein
MIAAASLYGLGPTSAAASSHREAPLVAADPAVDSTDFYAFTSPDQQDTVTFVANYIPFEEPNGGPNFYPFATDASYTVNVDSNGDAKPDITFRWTFKNIDKRGNNSFLYNNGVVKSIDDPNLLFRQVYTLEASYDGGHEYQQLVRDAPVAPSNTGPASMPDYKHLRDQAALNLGQGFKAFAGQAADPFFADLRVFDLLYGGNLSEVGQNTLAGYNVNTLVLQVPKRALALKGDYKRNPVFGAWTTAERDRVRISGLQDNRGYSNKDQYGYRRRDRDQVQVSRLGNPLVNEVVVPAGLKDTFSSLPPDQDAKVKQLVDKVLNPELPQLVQGIYKIPAPSAPRNDLAEIFLTGVTTKAGGPIKADLNSQLNNQDVDADRFQPAEELRLNMNVPVAKSPNRLGVLGGDLQGFPNGRRLTDDVIDISVQAMEGAAQSGKLVDALKAGDKVDTPDRAPLGYFPYVALPNAQGVNTRTSVQANNVSFLGGYGGSAPMAVGGLAALVALGGFMVSWYRRRDKVAVTTATTGGGTKTVAVTADDADALLRPADEPTRYSGRRRVQPDERPAGKDPATKDGGRTG